MVVFIFICTNHLQWKHKTEPNTVVGNVVDAPDIELSPALQSRLEEEDGPGAFDDLEAHAGDRGTLFPETTLLDLDQPDLNKQSLCTKRKSFRMERDGTGGLGI